MTHSDDLELRPSAIFAFLKIFPIVLLSATLLFLAWSLSVYLIFLSFFAGAIAVYRYLYICNVRYLITSEYIRITQGLFFRRVDQLEMYRIKDYVQIQSLLFQIFHLIDLLLKSTDPENPKIWLRGIPESAVVDLIRDRVQEARKSNNIYEIN